MSALGRFGTLYRDEQGHEVWRIVDADGHIVAEGVESDHDAVRIAEGVGGVSEDEQLTAAQVADLVGIKPGTFRAYRTRRVGRKYAPEPDGHYDARTPWWYRSTIKAWWPDRVD